MDNLIKAIEIEKHLRAEHKFFYGTFIPTINDLGFRTIDEYLKLKKDYLFKCWNPKIFRVDSSVLSKETSKAILNNQESIFICQGEGIYAFHGDDYIDYDLCNELDVKIVELGYKGGTIIGSNKDLQMLIIFPKIMMMDEATITNKFIETIAKYVPNTTFEKNDILVNNKKVAGTTWREFNDISVWTIQVSFADYSKYIEKICNKPSTIKEPFYIDNNL